MLAVEAVVDMLQVLVVQVALAVEHHVLVHLAQEIVELQIQVAAVVVQPMLLQIQVAQAAQAL
jgi:CRISPR/Cas system-associated endonuclease Cas3-HD